MPDTTVTETVATVAASDGYPLGHRLWRGPAGRALLVMQHGVLTHSGWFAEIGRRLAARGVDVLGHDRRGSGLNAEARGDVDGPQRLLDDLHAVVAPHRAAYPTIVHFGWCLGCTLGLRYLLGRPEMGEGLVWMSPDVYERHLRPAVLDAFARPIWDDRVTPRLKVPVPPEIYTDGPALDGFVRRDPLKLTDMTPRFLRATVRLKEDLEEAVASFTAPSLLILAGRDRIVDNERTRRLYERIGSARPRVVTFDCNHGIQFEARDELVGVLADFVESTAERRAA